MQNLPESLYRADQIREIERIAIRDLKIAGLQLMRSAGQATFAVLQRRWPNCRQITVFCGAGNNGGDGYVVAKLALQAGCGVTVYAIGDDTQLKGDALTSYRDFMQAGGSVERFAAGMPIIEPELIVDALLGTGLNRPVDGNYAAAIAVINTANCPVLAVDIPSGLNADSGCTLGCTVKADATVTFVGLKCGLFTGQANDYCGEIVYADLGVSVSAFAGLNPAAFLLKKKLLPSRARCAHKGHFGHVLLVGGNLGFSGAIRLAAEAALRSGAGLVSIASRIEHSALLNIGRPELMCHAVENAAKLHALLEKADVVVIGPGLGQDGWAKMLFDSVLNTEKLCVVDADALNLLAGQNEHRDNWILTPHPGEVARLLACSTADINADRYAAVTALQKRYGGVCLLKGAGSLIADAKTIRVGTTGNPGMASGGMGDVLSGIIGSLLAQGLPLSDAAGLAVYVHGEAADAIAAQQGERGMLASDLFSELRRCLN